METINPQEWKQDLPAFKEKTDQFYAGELSKADYKGFSGGYGSYAQKDGKASMIRLRMSGGHLTKDKLKFIADSIKTYNVDKVHLTTCQTIQLHNLQPEAIYGIMEGGLDHGIVTMGGGFSNGPANETHATFRDLGFVAREDGNFDVYSAGGLGNNARFGLKVAENVQPEKILYYICAMRETFIAHGNYKQRGRARTRYMQETLGEEGYIKAFHEKLDEVFASGQDLDLHVEISEVKKQGDGSKVSGKRVIDQKQEGLYAVSYHPFGGCPKPEKLGEIYDVIKDMDEVEARISPDETMYIINLTGDEAKKVLDATDDGAETLFETSVSCIGATICQVGLRDSQGLLHKVIEAEREAGLKDGSLPKIHISGCMSSCGTHQIGEIGFHGSMKVIDKVAHSAFVLHINGSDLQGKEKMGEEVGIILEEDIPQFLVKLGQAVESEELDFSQWNLKHPEGIKEIAKEYIK